MRVDDEHICWPPTTGRKQWWTCEACGQLWQRVDGWWRMTARERGP